MMRNPFPYSPHCVQISYFFWTPADCDSNGAVICKKKPRELDCIFGNGTDYQGKVNVSKTGRPCLNWNDPDIQDFLSKRRVRSALTTEKPTNGTTDQTGKSTNNLNSNDTSFQLEHNFFY